MLNKTGNNQRYWLISQWLAYLRVVSP